MTVRALRRTELLSHARGNRHAHKRAGDLSGRYSDFISREPAADRWPRQANRADHRDHSRRLVAAQIYRSVLALPAFRIFTTKSPGNDRGFLVGVLGIFRLSPSSLT